MLSIVWPGDPAPSQDYGWTDLAVEPVWQGRHFHCGIDIPLNVGTPLRAARGGTVAYVGWGLLAIKASDTQTDWYIHIDSSRVGVGAPIDRGNLIAYSGAKVPAGGSLTGPHIHFEVQDAAYNNPALGIFSRLNLPATSVDPYPILTEAFTPAAQDLGGLDMAIADQILAAVTMPPPARPASMGTTSDADLMAYANTAGVTWDAVTVKYGPDGRDYIYRLIHPLSIAQAIAGLKIGVDQSSLAAVLAKLDDLAAHPAVVSDPALAAQVASLAKHLGVGTA